MKKDTCILFLASWYPSRLSPQHGNFIQRHAEAVSALTKVCVLHVVLDSNTEERVIEHRRHSSIDEVIVYMPDASNLLQRAISYWKGYHAGMQKVRVISGIPGIIHLHVIYPAAIYAIWLHLRFRLPLVVTEHSTILLPSRKNSLTSWHKLLVRLTALCSKCVCPVSHDLANAMNYLGVRSPMRVIANVVDSQLFKLKEERVDPVFRFIHISTLSDAHKNVSGILEAFAQLHSQHTNVHLSLIGNAHHEKHRQYAKALSIPEGAIRLLAELPIGQIAKELRQHDAFVLFSHYENQPCVVAEALSCGLPVIATQVGGLAEMINEQNGMLIPAGDVVALVAAMTHMIQRKESYHPQRIRAAAVAKYDYAVIGQKYVDVYRS